MRHGKKFNHLSRKSAHRKALLRNLASALIEHKRITTTLAKAKALRHFVEPLITKAKSNTTHSRRVVFSYLQNKDSIKELFGPVAEKVGDRPGGYVRVIKTGFRKGDGAEMAMIELVDFNNVYSTETADTSTGGRKRRRRRRGGGGATTAAAAAATVATEVVEEEVIEEADVVEEVATSDSEDAVSADATDEEE